MYKNFHYYLDLADRTFNLLNGTINRFNTNLILLNNDEMEEYGTIYLRSVVYININKIIHAASFKQNYIETNIVYTIAHELYHADQVILDERYLSNIDQYAELKENEVIYRAITFMMINREELNEKLGINMTIESLYSFRAEIDHTVGINNIANYERFDLENCIIQDMISFTRISDIQWTKYKNVGLYVICNGYVEKIPIKLNWNYLPEVPSILQDLLRRYAKLLRTKEESYYADDDNYVIMVTFNQSISGIEYY